MLNKDDAHYMKLALQEAEKAAKEGEIPVGAIIVSGGQIIARAYNLTERLTDVTAHAEMQAITMAANLLGGKYLKGCTLYVTLEPCVMCAGALGWSQIDRIVIGASDSKRGYSSIAPNALHPKTVVTTGIMAEESTSLIQEFFASKR